MAATKRHPVYFPEKQKIVNLHQDRKSTCIFVRIVRRSGSDVKRIVSKFESYGSIETSTSSGRPFKNSPCLDHVIIRKAFQNRFKSAAEIL